MNLNEFGQDWRFTHVGTPAAPVTLWTGLAQTRPGLPRVKESLKYWLRACMRPLQTRRWLGLLNSHPAFRAYVRQQPRLVLKIYRPYASMALDSRARMDMLAAHYHFIFARGLEALVAQASGSAAHLASFAGKSGQPFTLQLRVLGTMEREGELVLQLAEAAGPLCSIAFTFGRDADGLSLHIGCVQGPRGEDGLARIRVATRELHGARPKNFLVNLVRQLGYEVGCRNLRMVGNANRVVRCSMRRALVHADYDQLWQECGARRLVRGDWQLDCRRLPAPDMAEIPSKRRAEMRRRHELHQQAAAGLLAAFR
jgi:hypothetical protein